MLFGLKVNILLIHNLARALAKNGSLGFAKGRLVYREKPNVHLAKIVFKKYAVVKKNTEALTFGSAI
jgi:hypothetical protein